MNEKFRDWVPKGELSINYKDGRGIGQTWEHSQEDLLERILAIAEDYKEQKIKLTARQMYYQLVAAGIIPNAIEIYKRISKFITDARYGGQMDWDAIEDRGRTVDRPSQWDNVKHLVDSAVYSYRLPRWEDQDEYAEMFCEKQALESVLEKIAKRWHIYFGCNKGYSSASSMYEMAGRLKRQILLGKKVTVIYTGDHDPSGLDMVRDITERTLEFLTEGDDPISKTDIHDVFSVQHVALKTEQVKQYNPPPNPAKVKDPRAKGYIAEFGGVSWELDALEPVTLRDLAETAIKGHLDLDKYNAKVEQEKEEIQRLKGFAEQLASEEEDEEIGEE